MEYLRNNTIVAAIFLVIGAVTVFVPFPEDWLFQFFWYLFSIFYLIGMFAGFLTASWLAIPEKYKHSFLALILSLTLCFISSVALSVFVMLATMTMAESHGIL